MMQTVSVDLKPISEAGGALVGGVDLRAEQTGEVKEILKAALFENGFLLFRDQELSPEQQIAAGRIFGTISTQGENYKNTDGVRYVSNVAADGVNPVGELTFHVDHSFYPSPLRAIMLYAIDVPPPGAGGETMLANARLAYKLLPGELRARIEGTKALHVYDFAYSRDKVGDRIRDVDCGPLAPRAIHPVVMEHPVTGEKILYISRRHVDRIFGYPEAESEALIDELLPYIYRSNIIYTHAWLPGDLLVFDNLALQHARTNFSPQHKRHMRRVQVAA